MRKFSKPILITVGILFGAVLVVYIGANLYLQSADVQARIRAATERAIGAPVLVRGISFTPWGGLSLLGLRVLDPEREDEALFEARRFRLRVSLIPLLSGKVEITSATLEQPIVSWREDLRWRIPDARRDVDVEGRPPEMPEVPAEEKKRAAPAFRVEIQRFRVAEGEIAYRDKEGGVIAVAREVNSTVAIVDNHTFHGNWSAAEINVPGSVTVREVSVDFQSSKDGVEVERFAGDLAGGALEGTGRFASGGGTFELKAGLRGADIERLLIEAGLPVGETEGRLNGDVVLEGTAARQESFHGGGKLEMVEASLEPLEALRQFGRMLSIDELQLLELETAQLLFTVRDATVVIDELTLATENLVILSEGTALFSGELDLDSKILVNRKLQRNLGGLLGKNFKESERKGYQELAFDVDGTVRRPRTNLLDRITGIRMGGDVGRFIQGIFGGQSRGGEDSAPNQRSDD